MIYENARQKSRQNIKNTMLLLMRTKPLRSITVTELCSMCRLNRSTFYAHYPTLDHLIRDLHRDLFLLMEDRLYLSSTSSEMRDEALFTSFLIHVCQEDERFTLFLRSEDINAFVLNMVHHFLTLLCPENESPEKRYSLIYHMVGAFTLLCTWIQEGYPCPAEALARQIIELSQSAKRP